MTLKPYYLNSEEAETPGNGLSVAVPLLAVVSLVASAFPSEREGSIELEIDLVRGTTESLSSLQLISYSSCCYRETSWIKSFFEELSYLHYYCNW